MKKKRERYLLRFMVIIYVAIVFMMTLGTGIVCAASDPLAVINNLSTFIFALIDLLICNYCGNRFLKKFKEVLEIR